MKTSNSLTIIVPWIGNLKVDYFLNILIFKLEATPLHHILDIRIKTKFALRGPILHLNFKYFTGVGS